jgi:endonuclease YncB( thermonuclease family)
MAAIPEPTPNYAHRARYVPPAAGQRYDGDSFRLELDLGAYVGGAIRPTLEVAIRLEGIDVVERTDRRLTVRGGPIGLEARDYALTLLELAHRITAQTVKPDLSGELGGTFERTRAHVWIDGEDLADALRAAGYSKADPHALA